MGQEPFFFSPTLLDPKDPIPKLRATCCSAKSKLESWFCWLAVCFQQSLRPSAPESLFMGNASDNPCSVAR